MTTWNDPQPQRLQQYTEWVARSDGKPPVQCTTSISVPQFDDGIQRLHFPHERTRAGGRTMTNPPDTSHTIPYADAQANYLTDWPIPYRLAPKAEALPDGPGHGVEPEADREPEAGS